MGYINTYAITTAKANKDVKPEGPSKDVNPTKFDDAKINRLFDMLNKDDVVHQCVWWSKLRPISLKNFKNPSAVEADVKGKFNAYCEIFAGTTYDGAWTTERAPTIAERLDGVKKAVDKLLSRITTLLDSSSEFNNLKVELMNKELKIIVLKVDNSDDGNDTYGSQLFLKFCYKK